MCPVVRAVDVVNVKGAGRIVHRHLGPFVRKFAAMLESGLPIANTLSSLQSQTSDVNFSAVIGKLKLDIDGGRELSESLLRFPSIFDDLFVNIVRSGEASGQLPGSLARLADFLEADARLRRKVTSAMIYPMIVLAVAGIATTLLLAFVVPVFAELFSSAGKQLPAPTQFLADLGGMIKSNLIYIVGGIVLIVFGWRSFILTPNGKRVADRLVLSIPIAGDIKRKLATARFAHTFAQLLKSGIDVPRAMDVSSGATGNAVFASAVISAKPAVEAGGRVSEALSRQNVFPPTLIEMMQAGEQSGKTDEMLENVANYYDEEVEMTLSGLSSMIQPLLIVIIGVIVGGIVVCMFLPVFQLPGIIK